MSKRNTQFRLTSWPLAVALREMIFRVVVIGMFGVPLVSAFAGDQLNMSSAATKELKRLEGPVTLRGDYFKAVEAAYEDFSRELASKDTLSKSQDADTVKLVQWLSKIENYDIYVDEAPLSYTVQFAVSLRNNAPPTFGGGAVYVVNRATFAVVKKTGFK